MHTTARRRPLIVNADDFGRSREINEAVLRAYRDGILTTASLMVTGEACAEAVAMARDHPGLGVGLHLTLVHGTPALAASIRSGVARRDGRFSENAPWTGFRYWARRGLRASLRDE
ncbi:MAG: ChbG/HpnK family deacetylase, partial [Verrucomicrobiales bacterium]|nr:ChbG/HpnK family deacetylase [Verrucomicrobiales bacterium]